MSERPIQKGPYFLWNRIAYVHGADTTMLFHLERTERDKVLMTGLSTTDIKNRYAEYVKQKELNEQS